ncbi:Rieske 2Fe-2S domain-containing protein [Dyella sp.]|uniref:Rieske 2Fe-2S domain-containing protein n=1 Tax=Dyella sp. TaxID=1869338 RepID=UPI002B459BBF|nr:Rieske 2Fe-2S domain-containing protein [Dyella sp.]HKT28519.1 Rieske 2Fe-2S domain-containing protein [Dyella sp.]
MRLTPNGALKEAGSGKVKLRTYLPDPRWAARPGNEVAPPWLPYPDGWFCVGLSTEWKAETIQTVPFMGEDIVIYRTKSGAIRAIHPYCPHLGAHLGAGGTVKGELLICPFHRFEFAPDGICAHTPYGSPPKASLHLLHAKEAYGIVWVWHHHNDQPPSWDLPDFPEVGKHPLDYRKIDLAGHPQEVMENAVDYGHLPQLHKITFMGELFPMISEGPISHMGFRIARYVPLLGTQIYDTTIHMMGIGGSRLILETPRLQIRTAVFALPTPIAPWRMRLTLAASVEAPEPSWLPGPIRRLARSQIEKTLRHSFLWAIVKDVYKDFPLWHHKKYHHHPRLNSGDGPIGKLRGWAQQFYPLSSVALIETSSNYADGDPTPTTRP